MIIKFFPKQAQGGDPSYLLELRKERVVAHIGLPNSFSRLASVAHTNNPTLAGAVCFETEVNTDRALEIARHFIYQILLGGADICAMPHLLVVHKEPSANGKFRTVVHFSILQFHLGLRLAVRPYLDRYDRVWLEAAQAELNRHFGFRDPNKCRHVFEPNKMLLGALAPLEETLVHEAEKWVLANGTAPSSADEVEDRLNCFLHKVVQVEAKYKTAKLVRGNNASFSIEAEGLEPVFLGSCPLKKKTTIRKSRLSLFLSTLDIDELAAWRKSRLIALYGESWTTRLFAPDLNRDDVYETGKKWVEQPPIPTVDEIARDLIGPHTAPTSPSAGTPDL
jgi:hypothetical protein